MRRVVIVTLVLSLGGRPAPAQTAPTVSYRGSWWDAASISASGVLYFTPIALGLPHGAPSCAPCDPATLPGIDRVSVRPVSTAAVLGSDVALTAVAGWAAFAGLGSLPKDQWHENLLIFANTATWTEATATWLKALIHRNRPVLYTSDAVAAATVKDNRLSMPGGHAAMSFAAATSYFVMSGREHLADRTRNAALLYGGAVTVSVLRVVAGKHFPTDEFAGAALGSGIGWLIPTLHLKTH